MIHTKEVKDLESYKQGIETALTSIENNFCDRVGVWITKKVWKDFKKEILEFKIGELTK